MVYEIKNDVLLTDILYVYVITLRDGKLKIEESCFLVHDTAFPVYVSNVALLLRLLLTAISALLFFFA